MVKTNERFIKFNMSCSFSQNQEGHWVSLSVLRGEKKKQGGSFWRNRAGKTDATPDVTLDTHKPKPHGKPSHQLLQPSWRVKRPHSWSKPHKQSTTGNKCKQSCGVRGYYEAERSSLVFIPKLTAQEPLHDVITAKLTSTWNGVCCINHSNFLWTFCKAFSCCVSARTPCSDSGNCAVNLHSPKIWSPSVLNLNKLKQLAHFPVHQVLRNMYRADINPDKNSCWGLCNLLQVTQCIWENTTFM